MKVYKDNTFPDVFGLVSYAGEELPTLAGVAATFTLKAADDSKKIDARACAVTDINDTAKTFKWLVAISGTDFDTVGDYTAYIDVTFANARTHTIDISETIQVLAP